MNQYSTYSLAYCEHAALWFWAVWSTFEKEAIVFKKPCGFGWASTKEQAKERAKTEGSLWGFPMENGEAAQHLIVHPTYRSGARKSFLRKRNQEEKASHPDLEMRTWIEETRKLFKKHKSHGANRERGESRQDMDGFSYTEWNDESVTIDEDVVAKKLGVSLRGLRKVTHDLYVAGYLSPPRCSFQYSDGLRSKVERGEIKEEEIPLSKRRYQLDAYGAKAIANYYAQKKNLGFQNSNAFHGWIDMLLIFSSYRHKANQQWKKDHYGNFGGWARNSSGNDSCFKTLGISPQASVEEINKAYKKLALKHHPDRGGKTEDFIRMTKAKEEALKIRRCS